MLQFSIYLLGTAFVEYGLTFDRIWRDAFDVFKRTWPIATLLAAVLVRDRLLRAITR